MEHHVSAGGVVYQKNNQDMEILLIAKMAKKVWCLPKGHVERGESFEEAARREIEEETGIQASLVKSLGDVSYQYEDRWEKKKISKTVHFYLFSYLEGMLKGSDREVEEVRWFKLDEVLSFLTYSGEREIFKRALEILKGL